MLHRNDNNITYSERNKNLYYKANPNRYNNRNDPFFQGNNYQMDINPQNNNDKLDAPTCHYQTKTNNSSYQYNRIYNTNSFNNHNFYSSSTQKHNQPNSNYINSYSFNKKHKILKYYQPQKQEAFSQTAELNIEKNENFNVIQINKPTVTQKREEYRKIHPGRGTSTSFINNNEYKRLKQQPELKYQSFNTSFISNGGLKNKRNKSSVKLRKNNLEDLNIDKLKDYAEKFSGIFLSKKNKNINNISKNNVNTENNNNKVISNKNSTFNSTNNSPKNSTNNIRTNTNSNKDNDSNKKTTITNENKNNNIDNENDVENNIDNSKDDKKIAPLEKYNNIPQPQKITNSNKIMNESNTGNKIFKKSKQLLIPIKEKYISSENYQSQNQLTTNLNIKKSMLENQNKKLLKKTKNLSNASSIATADDVKDNNNNNLKKNFIFHNINNTCKATEHKFSQKYNNQQYHEIVFKKNDSETNADDTSSNDKQYYLDNITNGDNCCPKKIIDNLNINVSNENKNYNTKENIFFNYKGNKYKYKNYGLDDRHNLDGISNHSYFESVNLKKKNKK